ncbi:uncharacterized protein LOC127750805 [Frankliniella occidentalis]|uniref:Uncharacterized protein LOC127750805 n=1 Tax=Frankliniella occidentalis TaxID=133901 RepID=A0A9C6X507_FRAOC|nr:uncharacterized protein LOC127750805 [Frankliniella occidentalis]
MVTPVGVMVTSTPSTVTPASVTHLASFQSNTPARRKVLSNWLPSPLPSTPGASGGISSIQPNSNTSIQAADKRFFELAKNGQLHVLNVSQLKEFLRSKKHFAGKKDVHITGKKEVLISRIIIFFNLGQ